MDLIISTVSKIDIEVENTIKNLKKSMKDVEIIYTEDMDIKGCIGCNSCWLITPGKCVIKDDYEKLLIKYLQVDKVIFITESKLGFVSHKLKNIMDRLLPLLTMNLKFKNGQMRHYLRYKKKYKMGLLYKGEGNQEFLDRWFKRVMLNIDGTSLGVYNINNKEVIQNALANN